MEVVNTILKVISQPWIVTIVLGLAIYLAQRYIVYVFKKEIQKLQAQHVKELEKIRQENSIELEKIKVKIEEEKEETSAFRLKKLELYTRIDEFVYRSRNKAREIKKDIEIDNKVSRKKLHELFELQDELVEMMFKEKFFLDKFLCFEVIHSYKNILVTFYQAVNELQDFSASSKADIENKYEILETAYTAVSKHFQDTSSHQI